MTVSKQGNSGDGETSKFRMYLKENEKTMDRCMHGGWMDGCIGGWIEGQMDSGEMDNWTGE